MKRLSEKLTQYIINAGSISEKSYEIYQYGFQIGLEMLFCTLVCLCIALYLSMISEYIIFTSIFLFLRTYAGGIHLKSFRGCFLCSITVQTFVLIVNSFLKIPIRESWWIIIVGSILILKSAPVESINRKLDKDEKLHCQEMTCKIISIILIFTGICTVIGKTHNISLVAITILVVMISQYLGIIKNEMFIS